MVVSVKNISNKVDISKYKESDESVISNKLYNRLFGEFNDYIEQHIYSPNGALLLSDYNYKGYTFPKDANNLISTVNKLEFDPGKDLEELNLSLGTFIVQYNILRKKIVNTTDLVFFIKEISLDRKEIRISSNLISDQDLEKGVIDFMTEIKNSSYYKDFLLNFGGNNFVTCVNLALDKNTSPITFLVKLYEPLPREYNINSKLFVVEELSDSYGFEVELYPDNISSNVQFIQGPNFDLRIDKENNSPSEYFNLFNIYENNNNLLSYQKIINKLNEKNLSINIDYSDYINFIHFSSARERLYNFVYKLQLIESYEYDLNKIKNITNYINIPSIYNNSVVLQNKIDDLIRKFDGYEKYLYYESSSFSWPKSNSSLPYTLYNTTSSVSLTWLGSEVGSSDYYGGQSLEAYNYDLQNQDNLVYTIPKYIQNDDRNDKYNLFINMIGHHYDNIWIYINSINDLYKNTNSFKTGISKDLVKYALKSLGITLYNSKSNDNIYSYLLGSNSSGSYIKNQISASAEFLSGEDVVKEIDKRLYHNINYLLKSKGTVRGLKALTKVYGISDSILDVIEYGGGDKLNNTNDYTFNRFSYALNSNSGSYVKVPWVKLYQNTLNGRPENVADTIEFRVKPDYSNIKDNQIIISKKYSGSINTDKFHLNVQYSASNGIGYGNFDFIASGSSQSASISGVPFWATGSDSDTNWWNIMIRRDNSYSINYNADNYYTLYIKNEVDGKIGHTYSASVEIHNLSSSFWNDVGDDYNYYSHLYLNEDYTGKYQELRLWSTPLIEESFEEHVLNPSSIIGNYNVSPNSSYEDLAARFSLGNNLNTYNHYVDKYIISNHPNRTITISGSYNSAEFVNYPNENNYTSFNEIYYNNINAVYSNPTSNKIKILEQNPIGDVLLVDNSIEELPNYYTDNQHYAEISFSPTNEINKDIISHYGGYLDIDSYIGDPTDLYKENYQGLEDKKSEYFKKYISKFNYSNYFDLLSFFDNSLFKMIEDFTPARANINTGLTIKSHILERNKIKNRKPIFEKDYNTYTANYSIGELKYTNNLDLEGERGLYGVLDGSEIDIFNYIESGNHNPYVYFREDFDRNMFYISDYNPLLGYVTESFKSDIFKNIDKYDHTILTRADIQDYNYQLQRSVRPRYDGSIMKGSIYNEYTLGDITYGKNPVIERNSIKIGWVNNIPSSSLNFSDKTIVNIKYLVDESGSLTNLNKHNKNLFEVQNIFKSGEQAVLSLSDINYPSIHNTLDGLKTIWRGGYSLDPLIYRENNESMTFRFDTPISSSISYLGVKAKCDDDFAYVSYAEDPNKGDVLHAPPTITANGVTNRGQQGQYAYYKNGVSTISKMVTKEYLPSSWRYSNNPKSDLNYGPNGRQNSKNSISVYEFDLLNFNKIVYNTEPDNLTYGSLTNSNNIYNVPRTGTYKMNGKIIFSFSGNDEKPGDGIQFKVVGIVERCKVNKDPYIDTNWELASNDSVTTLSVITPPSGNPFSANSNTNIIYYDNIVSNAVLSLNLDSTAVLIAGDYIRFKFYLIDLSNLFGASNLNGTAGFEFYINGIANGTIVDKSYFEIYDTSTPITVYHDTYVYGQTPLFFTKTGDNKILLDISTSQLINGPSIFVPNSITSKNYSSVVDYFNIEKHDIIRIGSFNAVKPEYYEILNVNNIGANSNYNISGGFVSGALNGHPVDYFLFDFATYGSPSIYFKTGDILDITNTTFNNSTKTVKYVDTYSIPQPYPNPDIIVSRVFFETSVVIETVSNPIFTFQTAGPSKLELTFDRNIITGSYNDAQSFAIFRPKPDETSVILNYRKYPGEVGKAFLLSKDLKKNIKDNIGNIYKIINPSL